MKSGDTAFKSALQEFEQLHSEIVKFMQFNEFIRSLFENFALAWGSTNVTREEFIDTNRHEIVDLIYFISDVHDDVASSWLSYLLRVDVLDENLDQREMLRENTWTGVSLKYSEERLINLGILNNQFLSGRGGVASGVALTTDLLCARNGVEPIALRIYAANAIGLANSISLSDVFSEDHAIVGERIRRFAAKLNAMIEAVDSSIGLEQGKSREQICSVSSGPGSLDEVRLCESFSSTLDAKFLEEWLSELFMAIESSPLANYPDSELEENDPYVDDEAEEDSDTDPKYEFRSVDNDATLEVPIGQYFDQLFMKRFEALNESHRGGFITDEEYRTKRRQMITEI